MKHSKYILLGLQILTAVMALALAIVLLGIFDVVSVPQILKFVNSEKSATKTDKIGRRPVSANAEYQEFLNSGDNELFLGNADKALAAYQKASELEPREALPYEKIGDIYFLKKNYNSARQNFELASSIIPTNTNLKIKIVRTLLGMRKVVEAKTELEKIQPATQASLYYQGLIAAFLNEQTAAKDFFAKSLAAGADEILKNNANKILKVYENFSLARDSRIEYLQALLAQAFDQVEEYGLAIEIAFDAIKTQHDYRDVWIILGHAFAKEQKWPDSEDALTRAIDLDASHPSAYFFRGIAKRNLNKINEAMADFENALKYGWQPRILTLEHLANIYFEKKDFEKAYPLYKEIVTTDSTDINRFIRPLALAINHLARPLDAKELAQKAFEAHPDTAMAQNLLGWAALANNEFTDAHNYLNEALKRDPALDAAYLNLGQLAEREGDREEALENYKKAAELAEKSGNKSVADTAMLRYNLLIDSDEVLTPNIPQNAPQIQTVPLEIPSLSLGTD